MKNDLSCEVVRDLLPSYLDGVASGETKAAVERHMEECPDCRETLRRMKEPEETALTEEKEIDYLKKVRRRELPQSGRNSGDRRASLDGSDVPAVLYWLSCGLTRDRRSCHRKGRYGASHRYAYRQRPERVPGRTSRRTRTAAWR